MLDFQHNNHCLDILVQNCKDIKQYTSLVNCLNTLQNRLGIEGLVDLYESYMSIERYDYISKLILNKENIIVVDCGCGHGWQQLLFQDCKRYIGIDIITRPFVLTDNALFYEGNVKDVIPMLKTSLFKKSDTIVDTRKYIDLDDLKGIGTKIEKLLTQYENSGQDTDTFFNAVRKLKRASVIKNIGACIGALGVLAPAIMLLVRKFGDNSEYQVKKDVEAKLAQQA